MINRSLSLLASLAFGLMVFCPSSTFAQSFTSLNGPYLGRINDLARTSTGVFFAATENGLYRSTDGANWTRFTLTSANGIATSFWDIEVNTTSGLIYAISFSTIFSSTDQGLTWSVVTTSGLTGTSIRRLKIAPNGNIWVADFSNVLFRANFATPTTFNQISTFSSAINDFDIGPSNQIAIATQNNSVQVSTNNGVSFNPPGAALATNATTYSVVFNSSGVLFALASDGPYRTTNNGTAWTAIKNNITEGSFFGFMEVDPSNNLYLGNAGFGRIYTVSAANSLLASPTWAMAVPPVTDSMLSGLFLSATNWHIAFGSYAVANTQDGGTNWAQNSTGIKAFNAGGSTITPRIFRSASNRLLMGWSGGGFFISIDDGATWDLLNTPASNTNRVLYGFITASDNSIIGYGNGVIRSTDNAQNWTLQNASPSHVVLTNVGAILYSFSSVNTNTTLQRSTDNGANWTTLALTGLPGSFTIRKLIGNATTLYLLINNGIYTVNTSTGACTLITTVPVSPNDLVVTGPSGATLLAVAGNSTSVAISSNGGSTWVTRSAPSIVTRIWAADENNIYGQSSTVGSFFVSNNAGTTWTTTQLGDATGQATDAIFSSQGFAYLAGSNMAVQKSNTVIVAPKAPTNLMELSKGPTGSYVVWDDNTGTEESYEVEKSVGNNTSYALAFTLGSFQAIQNKISTFVSADIGATTYVRVRATNDAGNSAYSNEITIAPFGNGCSPPAGDFIPNNRSWTATAVADPGFTATNSGPFTSSAAAITATLNGNLTSALVSNLRLGMGINGQGPNNVTVTLNERCGQATIVNSNVGTGYINNGNSTWNPATKTLTIKWQTSFNSLAFKGTTTYVLNASDPIPAATTLTASIYSNTEVFLSWFTSSFATSYDLERSTTSGSGFALVGTINYPSTSFLDGNLTAGQTYYYRIRSKNAAGSSANSAEVSVTPTTSTVFRPLVNAISQNFEGQQGASWGDFDNDGDDDIAIPAFTNSTNEFIAPYFYQNQGNNVFVRFTPTSLIPENTATSRGVGIFDYDNDNDLDVIIGRSGAGTVASALLLTNNGNWNFTKTSLDQTAPTGGGVAFRGFAVSDYDQDGFADVFLGSVDGSGLSPFLPSLQLKNNGGTSISRITTGTFATDLNSAMTLLPGDYDNDGDQDIFMVNRLNPPDVNKLFKNNGDGSFSLVTGLVFDSDPATQTRAGSWGDIDNDGDLDLFVGLTGATNRLYQNNGNGTFTSLTSSPVSEVLSATGSAFGDLDNDGDLDLVVTSFTANGIYINGGTGNFTKSTTQEIFVSPVLSNVGGAFSDFDNDGFLDFYLPITSSATASLPNLLCKNTNTASPSRNWIEVKLKGTISNAAALGARVTVTTTSPARTQVREVASATGYGSQNSLTQHFGLGTATTASQIQVRWPNGGIQTLTNVAANQIITITEDLAGPSFTLTPANAATGVALNSTLKIVLSEAGTPVAGKNIVIRKTSATSTPVQTISVTSGVSSAGNTFTITPAAPFDALATYFISVDAGAYVDAFGNPSAAVAATAWTFTTLDNVPPVVSFSPPANLPKGGVSGQVFSVTATDNVSVASVVMSYRKVTATQYQTLNGTFNAATSKYDFPLQTTFFDDMGMEYFFTAKDGSNNTTLSPATGSYVTRLTFSATTIAVGVAAGSQVADYKIISIPLDLATTNIANIFADFGAPDGSQWKLLKYQANPQAWLNYPNSFSAVARGEGYFILSREGKNLKFDGAIAPTFSQSTLFQLNLVAGFNLIGNPYTMPINWEDSRTGIAGVGVVKLFQGGSYADGNTIEVFSGGFVFANAAVSVPVKLRTSPNGGRLAQLSLSSRIDDDEWIVPIKMTQGERQFNFGGIGMSGDASLSYDDKDDLAPPSPYGNFEISFAHPEHFMKKFSRDVVPTAEGFTWTFRAETEVIDGTVLSWDNSMFRDNTKDLFLLDVSLQRPVNMKEESSYSFDPNVSREFKIFFGKDANEKLKPNRIFLGQVSPNPATTLVTIPFNLPDTGSNLSVRLEILDRMGKPVETLLNKNLAAGFYSTTWDASASTVSGGLYIVRLAVQNQQHQESVATKLVINK